MDTKPSSTDIQNPAAAPDAIGFLNRLANHPAETALLAPDLARAHAALQKLPSVHYLQLQQHFIRSMSTAEIALECSCQESTVLRWRELALQAFARQLQADRVMPRPKTVSRRRPKRVARKSDPDQFEFFK